MGETIEMRCKMHYAELRKILKFRESGNKEKHSRDRLNFLCRKMYLKEICKMKDCLSSEQVGNCFVLSKSFISEVEVKNYCCFHDFNDIQVQVLNTDVNLEIDNLEK